MLNLLSNLDWRALSLSVGIGYIAPPAFVFITTVVAAIAASNADTFGPTFGWIYMFAYLVSPILAGVVASQFARHSPFGIAVFAAVIGGIAQMSVFHLQSDIAWLPIAWVAAGVGLALLAVFVSGRAQREVRHDV